MSIILFLCGTSSTKTISSKG